MLPLVTLVTPRTRKTVAIRWGDARAPSIRSSTPRFRMRVVGSESHGCFQSCWAWWSRHLSSASSVGSPSF